MTSVPEIARIGHSGGNAESGENVFLEYDPENDNTDQDEKVFHGLPPAPRLFTSVSAEQFLGLVRLVGE
jgi:hypothetical protein